MAKYTLEEAKEYPTLPDDSILHVLCEKTEDRTVDGPRGKWEKVEFTFKILGILATGDGSPISRYENLIGENIYGSVSARFNASPENKLRLWAEALFNMQLDLGFELDTELLQRRECRAVTSTYEKRAINPQTQKPFVAHQVAYLLPIGNAQPSQPQQQFQQQPPQQWGQPQQGWGQPAPQQAPPQQGWGQAPAAQQQPQPQQQGWGAPGVPQQAPPQPAPQQAPPQQDPWGAQPPAPQPGDPWMPQESLDEPPF